MSTFSAICLLFNIWSNAHKLNPRKFGDSKQFQGSREFNELEPGSQLFLLPPARRDNTELGFVFPSHF